MRLLRLQLTLRQMMLLVAVTGMICASTIGLLPGYLFDGHTYMKIGDEVSDSSMPVFWVVQLLGLAVLWGLFTLFLIVTIYIARAIGRWMIRRA